MFNRRRWTIPIAALFLFGMGACLPAIASGPLPDPTRPVVFPGTGAERGDAQPAKWSLTSVLIAPGRRVAVINGQVVQVGEKVNGARLVSVDPGSALLYCAGQKIQLKLISGSVKQSTEPAP